MSVIEEIASERRRQIEAEGWTPEHDDQHHEGSMARAAAAFAYCSTLLGSERDAHVNALYGRTSGFISLIAWLWPWEARWFKPHNPRRDLIRAAALILAEIERIDRATERQGAAQLGDKS